MEAALPGVADARWRPLFEARSAAARLDRAAAQRILEPLLAPGVLSPEQRIFALATLAQAQFAQGDYRAAERTAREWIAELTAADRSDDLADAGQFLFVAGTLAGAAPQVLAASSPGEQPMSRDKVGLPRTAVGVNGGEVDAILDTGANLSVVSRSTAERLGLVMLGGEGSVGSATQAAVGAQIGLAERLTIAGAELRNVAFLVLDDAALTFPIPGGYTIDAIIGFPVFKALGRISFSRGGTFGWAPGGGSGAGQNLFADGNDLYLEAAIAEATVALHLDTGAAASDLASAFARRAPAQVAAHREPVVRARSRASAGGAVTSRTVSLAQVPVHVAGSSICLPSIDLSLEDEEEGPTRLGTIGQDVLGRFESYSIDFVSMRLEVTQAPDHVETCGQTAPEGPGGTGAS